ncbi:MAG: DUF3179 domain-containing protein [Desulfocapsaceae bacterium]
MRASPVPLETANNRLPMPLFRRQVEEYGKKWKLIFVTVVMVFCFGDVHVYSSQTEQSERETTIIRDVVNDAFSLLINTSDQGAVDRSFLILEAYWKAEFIPQLLEIMSVPLSEYTWRKTIELLTSKTGQEFGTNLNGWYFWLWNEPEKSLSQYGNFKADLYEQIDPKFAKYFRERQSSAHVRFDEIRWGGVVQDGIPPLRDPEMIPASQATYLKEGDIVFGIEIDDDARAYPKRILAWHEMFTDTIGGVDIAGVYCTLCGTIIPYLTSSGGVDYKLGTSGFLYRSNKLMYDQATQSLWSTVRGEPVIGPLVGKGIALEHLSMVTTTWGEWRRRHPDTTVLSLNTGHRRDYGEGVAYQNYFANDQLMFNTPFKDNRLANKQEVLALIFPALPDEQLAIDTEFLNKTPLYKDQVGQQKIVVLTDTTGANRVYDPQDYNFVSYDSDSTAVDSQGNEWLVSEEKLLSPNHEAALPRLPHRRAFWFGWHAAFPDTRLVY